MLCTTSKHYEVLVGEEALIPVKPFLLLRVKLEQLKEVYNLSPFTIIHLLVPIPHVLDELLHGGPVVRFWWFGREQRPGGAEGRSVEDLLIGDGGLEGQLLY